LNIHEYSILIFFHMKSSNSMKYSTYMYWSYPFLGDKFSSVCIKYFQNKIFCHKFPVFKEKLAKKAKKKRVHKIVYYHIMNIAKSG
jgi:hypothetical protein